MKKSLYAVLIVVLLAVFGVSAFFVGRYVLESREQASRFDELSQMKEQATATTGAAKPADEPDSPTQEATQPVAPEPTVSPTTADGLLTEYAGLHEINSDMVGWIKIEGTQVDYPVMQTPNNANFYLDKSFDKAYSSHGCIYVREECDVDLPSDNVTIYGHNMLDGSMFAALHKYEDKAFWEDNRLIVFDTLKERHVYEIFAVFKTSANVGEGFSYHKFVDAANEKEFNDFVSTCKDLGKKYYYDTGITPKYGEKLICLSTCEYSLGDNGRLVVAAVRIS